VQHHSASFLRSIRGIVHEYGHHRSKGRKCPNCGEFVQNTDFSTRQTPGAPDIHAFLRHPTLGTWRGLWQECKAEGGTLSPEQRDFREYARLANELHVVGGLDDLIACLLEEGYIHRGQVAHYRLPKAATS